MANVTYYEDQVFDNSRFWTDPTEAIAYEGAPIPESDELWDKLTEGGQISLCKYFRG